MSTWQYTSDFSWWYGSRFFLANGGTMFKKKMESDKQGKTFLLSRLVEKGWQREDQCHICTYSSAKVNLEPTRMMNNVERSLITPLHISRQRWRLHFGKVFLLLVVYRSRASSLYSKSFLHIKFSVCWSCKVVSKMFFVIVFCNSERKKDEKIATLLHHYRGLLAKEIAKLGPVQ